MNSGVRAVVAGHGTFAEGVLSAVAQISGRADLFLPLSNTGLGAAEILEALRGRLAETGAGVVFTDLPAGSWTIAARRLLRERPELVLVTGTNLATLLDFIFHEELGAREAARHAAEKGRAALIVSGGEPPEPERGAEGASAA